MSRPAVVDKLIKLGTITLGNSYHSLLKSGFSNSKSDLDTRVSFKVIPSAFPLLSVLHSFTSFTSPSRSSDIVNQITKWSGMDPSLHKSLLSQCAVYELWVPQLALPSVTTHYRFHNKCYSVHKLLCFLFCLQYSVSRGASATPTFYVNGFELPGAGSPMDFEEWRKTIDPLVKPQEVDVRDTFLSFLTQPSYQYYFLCSAKPNSHLIYITYMFSLCLFCRVQ